MSELISKELFDQFRDSSWPRVFSSIAQQCSAEDKPVIMLPTLPIYEIGLILAPHEDKQMLERMGIISMPDNHSPYFSKFGEQVIAACENLFTPEEHESASKAARPELEAVMAEVEAELGPLD